MASDEKKRWDDVGKKARTVGRQKGGPLSFGGEKGCKSTFNMQSRDS